MIFDLYPPCFSAIFLFIAHEIAHTASFQPRQFPFVFGIPREMKSRTFFLVIQFFFRWKTTEPFFLFSLPFFFYLTPAFYNFLSCVIPTKRNWRTGFFGGEILFLLLIFLYFYFCSFLWLWRLWYLVVESPVKVEKAKEERAASRFTL
jgi:hypothetical protein